MTISDRLIKLNNYLSVNKGNWFEKEKSIELLLKEIEPIISMGKMQEKKDVDIVDMWIKFRGFSNIGDENNYEPTKNYFIEHVIPNVEWGNSMMEMNDEILGEWQRIAGTNVGSLSSSWSVKTPPLLRSCVVYIKLNEKIYVN